ncbi:UNVERIFIED_CONTAM: Regulatory-associated protein of TOR 1 [Sesamum calycinum]|uniref:Regulatory-associated protein of TOR 1 n=1 Tax=Sesamum calycinum TaxID=2727403 RepID=A0AAW2LHH1_9LAMI
MALGDLMAASRFSQSSAAVLNHLEQVSASGNYVQEDGERSAYSVNDVYDDTNARDLSETASSSYVAMTTTTSMAYLPQTVVLCELRHDGYEESVPSGPSDSGLVSKWRPRERMKTGCVALVLCLNISVDPPDVIKISPCARMECWIDPFSMAPQKALEAIGRTLNQQYERWQPKVRKTMIFFRLDTKISLDPTVDEVKKLCTTCPKCAKSERVLFHYNGHGVPKPTPNGEIWLFNKSYTQYIPLPISDLDSWLRTPSIYVFDCSAAGMIVSAFIELLDSGTSTSVPSMRDCILLAACEAHETLQSVEFPADVFTSCLTTPIKMALRWFCTRSLLHESFDHSLIDRIPGRQTDRKTLLGELNWIFTAVTDTIAWNSFICCIFYPCALRDAWDMAAEICLAQLPTLVENPNAEFQPSPFFTEQLTAFEVWLDHGSEHKKPPEQLPIVLQIFGYGAMGRGFGLSVGIFPYVLKLLQTTTPELRQILVFIWTKILALDKSCQVDLVKDGGHTYFIRFLDSVEAYPEQRAMAAFVLAVIVDGHRRGQEACIEAGLTHICLQHLHGSSSAETQTEPLFLQWICLCLGKLWEDFVEAQMIGLHADAPAILAPLLSEPQPEVRAAAVFALGTVLDVGFDTSRDGLGDEDGDNDEKITAEAGIIKSLLNVVSDGSPLVRAEVAVALSRFAFSHNKHLKSVAAAYGKPQSNSVLASLPSLVMKGSGSGNTTPTHHIPHGSIIPAPVAPLSRVGNESQAVARDGRVSTSSPLAMPGLMHGSPLSDDSSQHSDSGHLMTLVAMAFSTIQGEGH